MKLRLVVLSAGKNSGQAITITQPQFLIGRDPDCQIRPASPMISKKHCALIQKDGKVYVKDFGSTNGTFVNDVKVEGHRELTNDDVVKVGPLQFRVALEVVSVDKPTPLPATSKKAVVAPAKTITPPPPTKTGTPPPPTKTPEPAKAPAAETPAPQPRPAPKPEPEINLEDTELGSATSGGEDDIAALLLSLGDGEGGTGDEVPGGTTLMEIPAIPPEDAPAQSPAAASTPEAEKKKDPPKNEQKARTSDAAAAILQKYARRPRPS